VVEKEKGGPFDLWGFVFLLLECMELKAAYFYVVEETSPPKSV
jgi:hypothetical protein